MSRRTRIGRTIVLALVLPVAALQAQVSCDPRILPLSLARDSTARDTAFVSLQGNPAAPAAVRRERPTVLVIADGTLLPIFLDQLKRLRDTSGDTLFKSVVNLNQYGVVDSLRLRVRELLNKVNKEAIFDTAQKRKWAEDQLKSGTCFLLARVVPIGGVLEFQLSAFDHSALPELTLNRKTGLLEVKATDSLPLPELGPDRSRSFFLDPRADDLEQRIADGLARLFPSVNARPHSAIRIDGVPVLYDSAIAGAKGQQLFIPHVAVDDSVILDATDSDDSDTPRERFRYRWFQVNADTTSGDGRCGHIQFDNVTSRRVLTFPVECRLLFDASRIREAQAVVPRNTGFYKVALIVSDQISEDTAYASFHVIPKPELKPAKELVHIGEGSVLMVKLLNIGGQRRSRWLLIDDADSTRPSQALCVRLASGESRCATDDSLSNDRVTVRWRKADTGPSLRRSETKPGYEVRVDNRLCNNIGDCIYKALSSYAPIFRPEVDETLELNAMRLGIKGPSKKVRFKTSHHPGVSFGVVAEQPVYTARETEQQLIEGLSKTRYALQFSFRLLTPVSMDVLFPADTASWRPYQHGALQLTYHTDVSPNAQTAVIGRFAHAKAGWQFLPGLGIRWRAMTRTDVNGTVLWSRPGKAVVVGAGMTMALL